jgi:hypothetical protein
MNNFPTNNVAAFAEVITSNLTTWTCQCWQWNIMPSFGSLVAAEMPEGIYLGVVAAIQTGSSDTSRTPTPYKKSPEELLAEHPEIFSFLATTFTVIQLAVIRGETIWYEWPPYPIHIHRFIRRASTEEITTFFSSHEYITPLCQHELTNNCHDELFLSLLRFQKENSLLSYEKIVQSLKKYSLLKGSNHHLLRALTQRVENLTAK